jgi:hypothetical protein
MKIIEGHKEVFKVYHDPIDDGIALEPEECSATWLTPLEAVELRDLLTKLIVETAYFRGLRPKGKECITGERNSE